MTHAEVENMEAEADSLRMALDARGDDKRYPISVAVGVVLRLPAVAITRLYARRPPEQPRTTTEQEAR